MASNTHQYNNPTARLYIAMPKLVEEGVFISVGSCRKEIRETDLLDPCCL